MPFGEQALPGVGDEPHPAAHAFGQAGEERAVHVHVEIGQGVSLARPNVLQAPQTRAHDGWLGVERDCHFVQSLEEQADENDLDQDRHVVLPKRRVERRPSGGEKEGGR